MIDLSPYFNHLNVKVNYVRKNRIRSVVSWTFTWTPEHKTQPAITTKLLDETRAIYNIKTNFWLSKDEKLQALDKYRGNKLGTAKKLYQRAHPNTYFFTDNHQQPQAGNKFARVNLEAIFTYNQPEICDLILAYERYIFNGMLNYGDIKDLILMEQLYAKRQLHETISNKKKKVFQIKTRLLAKSCMKSSIMMHILIFCLLLKLK